MIFCPKCGADAKDEQNYCRKCGVNLALVSKAVNLGEVIARGDGGFLPKVRSFIGNPKLDEVSAQLGRQMEQIGESLKSSVATAQQNRRTSLVWPSATCDTAKKTERSAADRRARLFAEGFPALFVGIAMMIVLFVYGDALVLKIPAEKAARIPFDLAEAAKLAWLFGLIPALSGLGRILAALFIPVRPAESPEPGTEATATGLLAEAPAAVSFDVAAAPPSVTEHTTARLDAHAPERARVAE